LFYNFSPKHIYTLAYTEDIENGHCMLFIKGKRSPKQLTNIQIITARDEAQQIQEQGTIRKRN